MSPEEWLASQTNQSPAATPAAGPMSPEQWAASQAPAAPAAPKEDLTKAAFGVRPKGIRQRTIADIAKESELAQQFGRDPSRAGQLSAADYITKMMMGAGTGGVIGAGIGAVTGPGALATGGAGAVMGGISGLAEAAAADLGFGPGTQTLAGLAAPSPQSLGKASTKLLGQAATDLATKGVTSAKDLVGEIAAHKMFGWSAYPLRRAVTALEKKQPVDVAALEAQTGIPAAARIKPGSVENVTKTRQDLAQQYGIAADKPESAIYEAAKTQYDNLIRQGMDFTRSKEFLNLVSSYPQKSQRFVQDTYSKIFKQADSLKPGDVVINDLKNLGLTQKQETEVRQAFNDYLERTTGKPWEAEARKAAEQVFVAKAKDQLPTLLSNSAKEIAGSVESRRLLKSQIQNFSKTNETRQVFWEETASALKDMSVGDAKALWNSIGPEVRKYLITDPQKYQKITDIMSGAKTPKEISNAARLMIKAGVTQFTVSE